MNKVMKNYLNYLNESGAVFLSVLTLIKMILHICMVISLKMKTKKIEEGLSKKLYEITKEKYTVISIDAGDEPNAFVYHIKKKDIYITTKLIEILNERQVIAILLHEAGHAYNKDMLNAWKSEGITGIAIALFAAIDTVAIKKGNPLGIYTTLILAMIFFLFIGTRDLAKGREAETRADVYTVQYGYGPDLISGLRILEKYVEKERKKLEKKNPGYLEYDKEMRKHDVHPEIKDRIKKLFEEIEFQKALAEGNVQKIRKILYKVFFAHDLRKELD